MKVASENAAHVLASVRELGASRQQERLVETDINQTMQQALALSKTFWEKVHLRLNLTEKLYPIIANPGDLVQIWVNIIKNACESMVSAKTEEATLKIHTFINENTNMVTITDNGPGIPSDLLPKIFQPNVTTKVQGLSFGLGLGLSIVQKLVEGYGGKITVTSKPEKTRFKIVLPKK